MKISQIVLGLILLSQTSYADGLKIGLGPISLKFGGSPEGRFIKVNEMQADPICLAIKRYRNIGLIIQTRKSFNDHEIKIVTKQIIIEPYLFGINNRRDPILKGRLIDQKIIEEATVKLGEEDLFKNEENKKPLFGKFQSREDVSSVNLDRIERIFILEDSHFDVPDHYDREAYSDIVNVICEIER